MDSLPLELVWYIACFLQPPDWLRFGLAYGRVYECILNPYLNRKYKSKFKKFYIKNNTLILEWAKYYHKFTHNGNKDGMYIDTNHKNSFIVKNYNNGKLHGYRIEKWGSSKGTGEFVYKYYINGKLNGIYIRCISTVACICNWRNGIQYGLEIVYEHGKLVKMVDHK